MNANIENTGNEPHIALIALYNYESNGVRTIYSILKNYGYKTTAIYFKELKFNNIELPSDNEINRLTELLARLKPAIIGISVGSSFYEIASLVTKEIRKKLSIPVLWGGHHPTIVPEESIAIADMICIGEGDEAILDLAKALRDGGEITNINNLWINKKGYVEKNPLRPLIQNLDWIPSPDLSSKDKYWIEDDAVLEGDPIWGRSHPQTTYSLMASRGCPFQCTYCSNSILKGIFKNKGSFVRRRSVENVINELRIVKEREHIKRIFFMDEVFASNMGWITDFCKSYKDEIGLPFICALNPTNVTEESVALLASAGLDNVVMGIESGSERTRNDIFERSGSNQIIKDSARLFNKYRIIPSFDVIMDNPFETEEDKKETVRLLLDLPRPFNLSMYSLCWFPRTRLTERALKEGIISEEMVEGTAKKTFKQWRMRLDLATRKEDRFWNALVFLASLRYSSNRHSRAIHVVPKWLVHLLMSSTVLRKRPSILMLPTLMLGSLIAPSKLLGFPAADYLDKLYSSIYSGLRLLLTGKLSTLFSKISKRIEKRKV